MPKSRTTKISKDLVQIDHKLGFIVIKPSSSERTIPLFCEVCQFSMLGELDAEYYKKYSCCSSCGIKWADVNQKSWNSGWRPTKEEIEVERKRRESDFVSFSL